MKNYVNCVLFLLISMGGAKGQIQFEHSDGFGNGRLRAVSEVEEGYLLAGTYILLLLDFDGNLVDSVQFPSVDTSFLPRLVAEQNGSYVVMGFAIVDGASSLTYWKSTYSKELVLEKTVAFPLEGFANTTDYVRSSKLYWESPSDTILFVGEYGRVCGWINSATEEVFSKDPDSDLNLTATAIIPRQNKPGYLVSGYGIDLLDENFNSESYYNMFELLAYPGWAGVDVEYITDSTFMFATHLYYPSFPNEYVDTGNAGVIVGVMTEDFEVLNTDTFLMPIETNWTLLPHTQYILERSIDSTFIVAGITWPYIGDYRHLFFAKYSNTGERLSYTTFYTPEDYKYEIGIEATSDGGCLFFGYRRGTGESEFYVLKVGPDGIITSETTIPFANKLVNVYPNPTSDIITFDMKGHHQQLDFELVDLKGRIVLRQKVSAQDEISTSHLPKGMYGYRLLNAKGEQIFSGKMVKE